MCYQECNTRKVYFPVFPRGHFVCVVNKVLCCRLVGLYGLARAAFGGQLSFDLLTGPDLVRSGRRGGFLYPIFKETLVCCSKELGCWLQLQVNETIETCRGM